jgi:glycine C-acetyltransferase
VIGFSYPVVPKGQARIRVQVSAAHEKHHLDRAIAAFSEVGRQLGVLKPVRADRDGRRVRRLPATRR